MKKVNLRELYPDINTKRMLFIEVSSEKYKK